MPRSLKICDEDVRLAEQCMGHSFSDPERSAVLQCLHTRDVQACPGSGKTTLLVAKLAILASKWRWKDRGICVLSHTNVARREVEKSLALHPSAHKVLQYPSFVGTIQSFVDQMLALPYMRSNGWDPSMIDNDTFAERAKQRLGRYWTARGWLDRQRNGTSILAGLRYEGTALSLGSAGGDISVAPKTPTFKQLEQVKRDVSDQGVFRYDDMYAFAQAHLATCAGLAAALGYRFPWVFIDEMQDTSELQSQILAACFNSVSTVQRFGDVNQAIYGSLESKDSETGFPAESHLGVRNSKRFGTRIAKAASNLTAIVAQDIECGDGCDGARAHTVFLFDESSISNVFPAFGKLLLRECDVSAHGFVAKAVGSRKNPPDGASGDTFPSHIGQYWPSFQPVHTRGYQLGDRLADAVRAARGLIASSGETADGADLLIKAFLKLLVLQGITAADGRRFTKRSLIERLQAGAPGALDKYRIVLGALCLSSQPFSADWWGRACGNIRHVLGHLGVTTLTAEAASYLEWGDQTDGAGMSMGRAPSVNEYVFTDEDTHRTVSFSVSTIHAVKGETHAATLVLETFHRAHDLEKVVPYLSGRKKAAAATAPKGHLKRIFVGITRPRHLVCLAMHKGHIEDRDRTRLSDLGWMVEEVPAAADVQEPPTSDHHAG